MSSSVNTGYTTGGQYSYGTGPSEGASSGNSVSYGNAAGTNRQSPQQIKQELQQLLAVVEMLEQEFQALQNPTGMPPTGPGGSQAGGGFNQLTDPFQGGGGSGGGGGFGADPSTGAYNPSSLGPSGFGQTAGPSSGEMYDPSWMGTDGDGDGDDPEEAGYSPTQAAAQPAAAPATKPATSAGSGSTQGSSNSISTQASQPTSTTGSSSTPQWVSDANNSATQHSNYATQYAGAKTTNSGILSQNQSNISGYARTAAANQDPQSFLNSTDKDLKSNLGQWTSVNTSDGHYYGFKEGWCPDCQTVKDTLSAQHEAYGWQQSKDDLKDKQKDPSLSQQQKNFYGQAANYQQEATDASADPPTGKYAGISAADRAFIAKNANDIAEHLKQVAGGSMSYQDYTKWAHDTLSAHSGNTVTSGSTDLDQAPWSSSDYRVQDLNAALNIGPNGDGGQGGS